MLLLLLLRGGRRGGEAGRGGGDGGRFESLRSSSIYTNDTVPVAACSTPTTGGLEPREPSEPSAGAGAGGTGARPSPGDAVQLPTPTCIGGNLGDIAQFIGAAKPNFVAPKGSTYINRDGIFGSDDPDKAPRYFFDGTMPWHPIANG